MTGLISLQVLMLVFVLFGNIVLAEKADSAEESDWEIMLGLGAGIVPVYNGSNDKIITPVPYIRIDWKDIITLGPAGLNVNVIRLEDYEAGIGLTYDPGRKEDGKTLFSSKNNDALRGLGDIDPAPGAKLFASYDFSLATVSSSVTQYFGNDNDGLTVDIGLTKKIPVNKRLLLTPAIKSTWGNGKYMRTYFGVSAIQSARSQFSQFNAEAGFKDISLSLNVLYGINDNWFAFASGQIKQLLNHAADSPISQKDTNSLFISAIGYKF